jgi:hypothetical protein
MSNLLGKLIKSPWFAILTGQFTGSGLVPCGVLDAAALNDLNQYHDDRKNQKDMDKPSQGVRRDKTKKPEDNKDDCKCSKHVSSPFEIEVDAG